MLYIFDKDNTLIASVGNRPANTPDEQVAMPNVVKKIRQLIADGHECYIASNQGGVSFGYISDSEARALMQDACVKCGIQKYNFLYCPYMLGGQYSKEYEHFKMDRKPEPGMLIAIMKFADAKQKDTIMIGDQESDRQAAKAAGVKFAWAKDFFEW